MIIFVKDKNNNDVELDDTILGNITGYILSNDYDLILFYHDKYIDTSFKYEELLKKV